MDTKSVTVAIPWRSQPQRVAAFTYVVEWWQSRGFKVVLGDSPHGRFNVSAARNRAVEKASTEIVIVADADTVPHMPAIQRAIDYMPPNLVTYPFTRYVYTETDPVDFDPLTAEQGKVWNGSVGGLLVTTKTAYWSICGMDERFDRWGWEDNAFHMAAETLIKVARVAGTVHAFGHEAERDMSEKNPGRARIELYRFARGKPAIMRELIRR